MDFAFLVSEFVHETTPLVVEAESKLLAIERTLASDAHDEDLWRDLLGVLHTIKGNAGMVRLTGIQELAHAMEDHAGRARSAPPADRLLAVDTLLGALDALRLGLRQPEEQAALRVAIDALRSGGRAAARRPSSVAAVDRVSEVRVDADKLDRLLELVGELTTHHRRVDTTVRAFSDRLSSTDPEAAATIEVVDQLGAVIREFRGRVSDIRLFPLGAIIVRFERLVRDLCAATGKRAALHVSGEDTVVDKTIADAVGEPLLHMLRNAMDHGVETPEERVAAGKPPEARIDLAISLQSGELVFSVRDDGRGLDRDRLADRARSLGMDVDGWADDRLFDLVFAPDLSTSEQVTELSGRGVGLDAAKRAIERVGGTLLVESRRGFGAEFRFRIPLTLTIQRTLLVRRCDEVFAMPIASVLGTERAAPDDDSRGGRGEFMLWRGALVPLCDLGVWLAVPGADQRRASLCVVVDDAGRPCGFLVDEVLGQQEVVLKELDASVGRPPWVAGATVLGDGRVAVVLDPRAIAAARRSGPRPPVASFGGAPPPPVPRASPEERA
jgi:two-component system chemotaxis sensor kinase CheA